MDCNYIHVSLFWDPLVCFVLSFIIIIIIKDATSLNIKLYLHLGTLLMGFIPRCGIAVKRYGHFYAS